MNINAIILVNTVHPDTVPDAFDEVIDEPNFNNFNTSPDPPSPYADLEKKYRKNRFNKSRARQTGDFQSGQQKQSASSSKSAEGNRTRKRKPKKKPSTKAARPSSGRRSS